MKKHILFWGGALPLTLLVIIPIYIVCGTCGFLWGAICNAFDKGGELGDKVGEFIQDYEI